MLLKFSVLWVFCLVVLPAHAYIGPGVGAGVVATVLGIVGAFILGIVGIVYYPIKRFLKNRKLERAARDDAGEH